MVVYLIIFHDQLIVTHDPALGELLSWIVCYMIYFKIYKG